MRLVIHLLLVTPLLIFASTFIYIAWEDPVKKISDFTGLTALYLLIFLLSLRVLKRFTPIHLLKYRRAIGLWAFTYVFLHAFNYLLFDHELNILAVFNAAFEKPYLFFGFIAFFILLYMAITSIPKLFKKLHKTHLLLYPAMGFIFAHTMMSQKVITLEIYGYLFITALLIVYRFIK